MRERMRQFAAVVPIDMIGAFIMIMKMIMALIKMT